MKSPTTQPASPSPIKTNDKSKSVKPPNKKDNMTEISMQKALSHAETIKEPNSSSPKIKTLNKDKIKKELILEKPKELDTALKNPGTITLSLFSKPAAVPAKVEDVLLQQTKGQNFSKEDLIYR